MDTVNENVHYSDELEQLIKDEAEMAYSYYLLHNLSFIYFNKLNNYINIPVMILSTITGSASVGSSSLFGDSNLASIIIGLVIILLNSLQGINTYFKYAQLAEAHKIASVSFIKISRFLELEMSLPRKERQDPNIILKVLKSEMDRLLETSPIIQPNIICQYNERYKEDKNKNIKQPAIVNGLKSVIINKSIVETPTNIKLKNIGFEMTDNEPKIKIGLEV